MVERTFGTCTSSQWAKNASKSVSSRALTRNVILEKPERVQGNGAFSVFGATGSAPSMTTYSRVAQGTYGSAFSWNVSAGTVPCGVSGFGRGLPNQSCAMPSQGCSPSAFASNRVTM